jgi:hypothetical protein
VKRITRPAGPSPFSARYTPAPTPTGSAMRLARPTMKNVPTMAFPTPPPGSPTGVGRLTKKEAESPGTPRETTSQSKDASGTSATRTPEPLATVQNPFTKRRHRSVFMPSPPGGLATPS